MTILTRRHGSAHPPQSPAFINHLRVRVPRLECCPMDMMAMVTSLLAAKSGGVQMQVAAAIMKSNADAEKFAVQTLLGAGASSLCQCRRRASAAISIFRLKSPSSVITLRGEDSCRIISARKATRREQDRYYAGHREIGRASCRERV